MQPKTNSLTKEEKQKHVEQALASGLSQKAYADQNGLIHSSLSYWIKQEREKHTPPTPRVKQSPVPALAHPVKIQAAGNSQQRIDILEAENRDLRAKVVSLQNVVMILGHQIGE